MNVLIVDDEKLLVKGLKNSLVQDGFNVITAYDGQEALDKFDSEKIDLIILDLMLPVIDGMTVCKKIRQRHEIPIIMLTAKDDYIDKTLGLEIGADDYMTKPFHTRELIARIKAVHRRFISNKDKQDVIEFDSFRLNLLERTLYLDEKEIQVTAKEYEILKILVTNRGVVFSRERLYELAWNEMSFDTRTVDVHISKLREKIEQNPSNPQIIKTKWGVGYYIKKEGL